MAGFDNFVRQPQFVQPDFTDQYNTPLDQPTMARYEGWRARLPENYRNTRDYDLQGYYLAATQGKDPNITLNLDPKGQLHLVDTFKKPNHPTFSVYSQYNGRDGYQGGNWMQGTGNQWIFMAHPSNMWTPQALNDYFLRAEQGNVLLDPRAVRRMP